jgi:hypothetical protein
MVSEECPCYRLKAKLQRMPVVLVKMYDDGDEYGQT